MVHTEKIAIKTTALTKRFKDLVAVDHVTFEVKKGEIFGLLGPNGAGKTTLIRMLCTLARPSEGSATVAGYEIGKEDGKIRKHIGLVSEKMIMYEQLTAKENLKLFGKLYDIPKDKLYEKMYDLLKLVNMENWADKQVGTFSTGMKQRINVIRALLNEPEILFLDEPTLGLDPQSTSELREFIRKINTENGTSMILTTHMMSEADMLCNRIGIIDYGKIIALDTAGNLKKMISDKDTTVVELDISNLTNDIISHIESLESVQNIVRKDDTNIKVQAKGAESLDEIIDVVRKLNGTIRYVKSFEPTLEDVFLHMTGREMRARLSNKVTVQTHRHRRPKVKTRVR
ncbi:MAG: ABC transporter ATP-binding protein [Candidatus Helarchaeota archaeon]